MYGRPETPKGAVRPLTEFGEVSLAWTPASDGVAGSSRRLKVWKRSMYDTVLSMLEAYSTALGPRSGSIRKVSPPAEVMDEPKPPSRLPGTPFSSGAAVGLFRSS